VIAVGVVIYAFARIFIAPNGYPYEGGIVSFCRFAAMTWAFADFGTAIAIYCVGAVALGVIWLISIPNHEPCPKCGATSRTDGGICKSCGHDFFPAG
jgi:hypothetical protein